MSDIAPGRVAPIPHGTYSGYVNHKCRCEPRRVANSAYQREYRATRKNYQRDSRARTRAYAKLAAAHPDEYAEILNNERQREGLPPTGTDGRGAAFYVEDKS